MTPLCKECMRSNCCSHTTDRWWAHVPFDKEPMCSKYTTYTHARRHTYMHASSVWVHWGPLADSLMPLSTSDVHVASLTPLLTPSPLTSLPLFPPLCLFLHRSFQPLTPLYCPPTHTHTHDMLSTGPGFLLSHCLCLQERKMLYKDAVLACTFSIFSKHDSFMEHKPEHTEKIKGPSRTIKKI